VRKKYQRKERKVHLGPHLGHGEHHGGQGLLEDLVDRGLNRQRRYLVVIDGSKALRAARLFNQHPEKRRVLKLLRAKIDLVLR
jgi:hypothetical protein